MQWRQSCYFRVLAFGRSPLGRLKLQLYLRMADLFQWLALICLGFLEFLKEPRPLTIKPSMSMIGKGESFSKDVAVVSEAQTAVQMVSMQPSKKAL